MTFPSDYPGAIVVEAANYGYRRRKNIPRGFVYHTPEEIADDDPSTPNYLASTTREASYTYFVSYLGFVFQLVPESEGAYANFVNGKPYPTWANPNINLNLQSISVSFEGMAATVHRTMVRGQAQWNAAVDLVAHRCEALDLSPDDWARHADVSVARSDPGSLNLVQFTLDVIAKMQEDDMTQDEFNAMFKKAVAQVAYPGTRQGSPDSAQRIAEVWAGEIVKLSQKINALEQGGGGGYTDADAVKAVKDAL